MAVPVSLETERKDLREAADIPFAGGFLILMMGLSPAVLTAMLLSDIPIRMLTSREFLIMTPISVVMIGPFGIAWDALLRSWGMKVKILFLPVWLLSLVYTGMGVWSLVFDPDALTIYWVDLIPGVIREWFLAAER